MPLVADPRALPEDVDCLAGLIASENGSSLSSERDFICSILSQ